MKPGVGLPAPTQCRGPDTVSASIISRFAIVGGKREGPTPAPQAAGGIRSVLSGDVSTFSMEYPCHSATEQHWFLLKVTALGDHRGNGAVVMHIDVTSEKQASE